MIGTVTIFTIMAIVEALYYKDEDIWPSLVGNNVLLLVFAAIFEAITAHVFINALVNFASVMHYRETFGITAASASSLILVFHFIIAGLNIALYITFAAATFAETVLEDDDGEDDIKCLPHWLWIVQSLVTSVDELSMLLVINMIRKKSVVVKASLTQSLTRLNSVQLSDEDKDLNKIEENSVDEDQDPRTSINENEEE